MLQINANAKRSVEMEIVKTLREKAYTLNTMNNYGENLLHISAANGCLEITKEILGSLQDYSVIDRKNKFGWTPLMQAIRNGDIQTTKLLLYRGSSVNESNYLGMSTLGLAAAISKEMFDIVYNACPNTLENATNDDINPLCIAAMKNDKELFFHLLDLGMKIEKANQYTHIMMKGSSVPEIVKMAKPELSCEDYWNDSSDNIEIEDSQESMSYCKIRYNSQISDFDFDTNNNCAVAQNCPIMISNYDIGNHNESKFAKCSKILCSNLLSTDLDFDKMNLISPTLAYNKDEGFPSSPLIHYIHNNSPLFKDSKQIVSNFETKTYTSPPTDFFPTSQVLQRLQSIRPPNLNITPKDLNTTLVGFIPEFSPAKSPGVPSDINDENVFDGNTPTPPHYSTPPRGMVLNSEQDKMVLIFDRFHLGHHIPIFLEQEVDLDLFLTLTEEDLIEIGIKHEQDRKDIMAVVQECRKIGLY